MPKRKEPELDPKEQFKRFQEAAKEAGVDDSGKQAENAFQKLAHQKSKPSPKRSSR